MTKKDIDETIDNFITSALKVYGKSTEDGVEDGKLKEKELELMWMTLMDKHGEGESWDEEEYDKMFAKFEDDEEGEDEGKEEEAKGKGDEDGMDRGEVAKMLKYICSF